MAISDNCLKQYIVDGDNVLVGVSGGADSMCLVSLANKIKDDVDFNLYAVHINHNIRESEAVRDQEFVRDFCLKNGVNFICENINTQEYAKQNGKTVEQAGRELRYDVFGKLAEKLNINKILIAHHKNDQAETVLMHIARGSSLSGASGMKTCVNNIVRPLLGYTREEIITYNKANNIDFIEDSSNSDVNYTRNYVRKIVLKELEKVYPNIVNSLCLFAEKCARDEEYINSLLPFELISVCGENVLLQKEIAKLPVSVSSRLIKKAFEKLNVLADIEEKHIMQIIDLFNLKNGSSLSLPHKVNAYKEYKGVVLTKNKINVNNQKENFCVGKTSFAGYGEIDVLALEKKQDVVFGDGNHYLDLNKIPAGAIWRTKQDGDVFSKLGSGGKKLNDYLIDKKIPRRLRESIPVLANGNTILAVAGLDISQLVKIDETTSQIVKIIYNPNNILY